MTYLLTLLPQFESLPSRTIYTGCALAGGLVLTIQLLLLFFGTFARVHGHRRRGGAQRPEREGGIRRNLGRTGRVVGQLDIYYV